LPGGDDEQTGAEDPPGIPDEQVSDQGGVVEVAAVHDADRHQ
jgi:hypothetical protein